MNAAAARPKTGFKFMLIVKGGPDKGTSYQLLPPKVTIGRDATSNISLSDPRVSRHAAVIEFSMERILITDASARKTLIVDGHQTSQAEIVDGSVIQIGDSHLIFAVEAMQMAPQGPQNFSPSPLQSVAEQGGPMPSQQQRQVQTHDMNGAMPQASAFGNAATNSPGYAPSHSPPKQGLSPAFKGLIALVILFALYVGLSEKRAAQARKGITTSTDIQNEINSSEKLQEELKKKRVFKSDEEKTRYEEANRHYLEGFRDYQNLQYSRALRSFETALAIDPANELARRYYNLAQKQRDDMVANLILEGRTYRDKLMYARCSSALEKAMDFMSNRDDLKYKQVESMKKECDLLLDPRN